MITAKKGHVKRLSCETSNVWFPHPPPSASSFAQPQQGRRGQSHSPGHTQAWTQTFSPVASRQLPATRPMNIVHPFTNPSAVDFVHQCLGPGLGPRPRHNSYSFAKRLSLRWPRSYAFLASSHPLPRPSMSVAMATCLSLKNSLVARSAGSACRAVTQVSKAQARTGFQV